MRRAILDKIFKSSERDFVGINLGGYCLKGVTVESGKITTYFTEKTMI